MADFVKVAKVDEVPQGEGIVVEVNGVEVALFNVDGNFCAINNTCLHRGGPLGEGYLEGEIVTCPWHGWQYDVMTGVSITNPRAQVKRYEVKVEGSEVKVALD